VAVGYFNFLLVQYKLGKNDLAEARTLVEDYESMEIKRDESLYNTVEGIYFV